MARRRVWFARSRALAWAVAGLLAWPLGWANSIVFVVIASVYANVTTDLSVAEAADDGPMLRAVGELRDEVKTLRTTIESLARQVRCTHDTH